MWVHILLPGTLQFAIHKHSFNTQTFPVSYLMSQFALVLCLGTVLKHRPINTTIDSWGCFHFSHWIQQFLWTNRK